MTPPRVAGYALAKLLEGDREQEILREQSERITAYAGERGWDLRRVYVDGPILAAGRDRRQGLRALLEDLEGLEKVIVVTLDRLLPGAEAAFELLQKFRASGVDVVSLDEELDTGEPSGRAATAVLGLARTWQRRTQRRLIWDAGSLRKPGFAPATVLDVGAGSGTPPLYEAFPAARHVLIDPLEEFRKPLERIAAQLGGEYLQVAVGAENGTVTINVNPDFLFTSAIRNNRVFPHEQMQARDVRLATLDTLRDEHGWQPPFGLKIDTEGYEDQVLEGASRLLEETQFIVAEVTVKPAYDESYSFAELIGLLDRLGFRLCEVLTAPKARDAHETEFMDAVFRRDDAPG
jgi:FkbM family methyltransferase